MITIRELHVLAFGEGVAAWYAEACAIWAGAYGQAGEPPVLLLAHGGYAHYGGALADAGPTAIEGRLTRYQVRLFSNHQTRRVTDDAAARRDLIAHELGHVYERLTLGRTGKGKPSTHACASWRAAIVRATPYLLPRVAAVAADAGVPLADVFARQEHRTRRNPATKAVERYRDAHAIPTEALAQWPDSFRTAEGVATFARVVEHVAQQQATHGNAPTLALQGARAA